MNAQKHNEEKLNEAFAQKCGVYLIFSVNMSGHFQGYARMMSYVSRQQVRYNCLLLHRAIQRTASPPAMLAPAGNCMKGADYKGA